MSSSFKVSRSQPPQVVIIGASAAGLFTAYLLAKEGVRVRLFDESEQLGPPPRTLIVTSRICDVLGFVPREAIVHQTPHVQLFSPGRSASIHLRQPDLIIEREALIRLLANKARAAGAEICLGDRFLGLEPERGGLVLRLENSCGHVEHVRTRVLIGADGASSQVARAMQRDSHQKVFILQARVVLPPGASPDTTQVWFDPRSTRYFYWLIPESQDRGVVGLIAENRHQARRTLDHFLSVQNLEPLDYQSAPVPFYTPNSAPWRRISGARIFLVGDAAAQVKVTTVGGVVTGLRGAQAVARAILQGNNLGQEWRALERELKLHLFVRRVLDHLGPSDYDQLLSLVNARAQRVLAARTRDEAGPALFLSLLVEPRLFLLAARHFPWRNGTV
ncbi:MAG: NAD(P)/FAD-dependent oxidoreductase [Chloroflexi bacterium]|nr:NAD(P)/FAD-dependent oxidoreductase [Chloroflexota bacterium]